MSTRLSLGRRACDSLLCRPRTEGIWRRDVFAENNTPTISSVFNPTGIRASHLFRNPSSSGIPSICVQTQFGS
jgi:hypothetical protein